MTCRQRKLKCTEEKPTCAQCAKASRTCIPASGITFRHQQNPSMNENQESLKSFYGYKETFAKAAQWVPVSKDLTWIHTSNPYNDIDDEEREQQRADEAAVTYHSGELPSSNDLSQADYSAFTEGLAALSAVASQDQYNLAPSSASMGRHSTQGLQPGSTPQQQLEFILNPASRMSEQQLDPQLQMLDTGEAHTPSYVDAQSSSMPKDAQP